MKNLLLTCFFLAVCITSFAQTSRGSFKIDGSFNYSYAKDEIEYFSPYGSSSSETTNKSIGFQPTVSYFVIKSLAVGGSIGLNRSTTEDYANRELESTSVTAGPSVQYYVPLAKSLYLVPGASIRWGKSKSDGFLLIGGDGVSRIETEGTTRKIDVGLGLTYFLNRIVCVDFVVN